MLWQLTARSNVNQSEVHSTSRFPCARKNSRLPDRKSLRVLPGIFPVKFSNEGIALVAISRARFVKVRATIRSSSRSTCAPTCAGAALYAALRVTRAQGFRRAGNHRRAQRAEHRAGLGCGFTPIGVFHRVGYTLHAWHDTQWLERSFGPDDGAAPREPIAVGNVDVAALLGGTD